MMTAACRWLAATLALAALAGCDKGKEERAQAAGEILEGTASDAMLKTDQIRSEAPLAPRATKGKTDTSEKGRATRGPAADDAEDAPTANDAAAPAEPPPAVPPVVETPETSAG
jgi:hypothetical protein